MTDLDLVRAERDLALERLRKVRMRAEELVEAAMDAGFGPEDIGPTGRELYIEIAMRSGETVQEIYSMFMSPRRYGIAA